MPEILKPGQGILYMKVGTHAQESLEAIIQRKTKEIEEAGYALWGYGGGTCHPQTMVQPFARNFEQQGQIIYLCMEPMQSSHFAHPLRAAEFSVDGTVWTPIPRPINVLGSRYALAIKNLRKEDLYLPLTQTRVALGNSMGSSGARYIAGRVDKACLEIIDPVQHEGTDDRRVHIELIAELIKPYAVYVRNDSSSQPERD